MTLHTVSCTVHTVSKPVIDKEKKLSVYMYEILNLCWWKRIVHTNRMQVFAYDPSIGPAHCRSICLPCHSIDAVIVSFLLSGGGA